MKLTCAADDCTNEFTPQVGNREFCSERCAGRMRVRRYRERHKLKPNGGGPGKRQRRLFPKALLAKAKPPQPERRPKQDALFPAEEAPRIATLALGYRDDGSVSDKGIMLTSRRLPISVAAALLIFFSLALLNPDRLHASNPVSVVEVQGALPQEKVLPAKATLQRVVHRKPVPFMPHEREPQYLLVYVVESLECGHTVTVYPQADPLIAQRRRCLDCDGGEVEAAQKKPSASVRLVHLEKKRA